MFEMEAIVLCDLVVQAPNGKLQLQGLFDVIQTVQIPSRHQGMWIFFRFRPSSGGDLPDEHRVKLEIRRPNGESYTLPNLTAKRNPRGAIQGYLQVQGLPLQEEGEHYVVVSCDDQQVGEVRFLVMQARPQAPQASTTVH